MRAVAFNETGGPDVLHVVELPEPAPTPGHVRIAVHAAAVNPSDLVTRSGLSRTRLQGLHPPYVPGWDAAGTVIDADPASGWHAGDAVIAITEPVVDGGGAYAEVLSLPAESVTALPAGVDFAAGSTLPMNGLTVLQAFEKLGLNPGDTLAVTGGAGAVGGLALQIAKERGVRTIADAKPGDRELLERFGADTVIERGPGLAERIREHYPEGVDAVLDGAMLREDVIGAVRSGGGYAALRSAEIGGGVDARPGVTVHLIAVNSAIREKEQLDWLSAKASRGALSLRVAAVLPADEAAEAHRMLEAGGLRGRVVLSFR